MALKSLAKAESIVKALKDNLSLAFAGSATINTFRQTADSQGWPILVLSLNASEVAGADVIFIKAQAQDAVSKDILGNDLHAATPHKITFAYEKQTTDEEPAQADIYTALSECIKMGAKSVEVKEVADGTAVDDTSVSAASAIVQLKNHLVWKQLGQ